MAEQHMGSLLPIKNRVIEADKNTTFLAHYDLNANDVLNGIEPIGSTQSLQFNGGSNYIDTPLAITASTDFTVMAHICPSSGHAHILTQYITNEGLLIQNTSGNALQIYINEMSALNYSWAMGVWYHVAVTHSNNKATLYVDGVKIREVAVSNMVWPNYPLRIGNSSSALNRGFNGKLRSVEVFKKALSENEIKLSMGNNYSIANDSLIGLWKMDEGYGSVIKDSSGLHNDAVITGGITWASGDSTFTLKPKEGRFGGGVIVEEGTTNLLLRPTMVGESGLASLSTAYGAYYEVVEDSFIPGTHSQRVYKNDTLNNGGTMNRGISININGVLGDIFTFSFYGKGWEERAGISFYSANLIGIKTTKEVVKGGWTRYQATGTLNKDGGTLVYIRPNNNSEYNFDCLINAPQVEKKAFATSFVDGTREKGKLHYPVKTPHPNFTMSFWYKHEWGTVEVPSGTNHLVGDDDNSCAFMIRRWDVSPMRLYIHDGLNARTWSDLWPIDPDKGTWQFVAIVKEGTSYKIYKNGSLITTHNIVKELEGERMMPQLGGNTPGNFMYDELKIDSVARTEDEILAWYYSNSPFYPKGIYKKSY